MKLLLRTGLLLALGLPGGCGFNLRGAAELPTALQTLTLESLDPGSEVVREMRRALVNSGVELVEEPAAGIHRLGLGREESRERVISVNSVARAGEYEITMSLPFQLRAGERLLMGPETLVMDRVYLADPENAVAKAEEAELIREEMRRDMVAQILRRLQNADLGESAD